MDDIRSGDFHTDAVKDPEKLFGWNKEGGLLGALVRYAVNGRSFFLRGERRSGKTSLLYCLTDLIKKNHHQIVPVYVDCQEFEVLGTPYGYILSLMAEALVERLEDSETWQGAEKPLLDGYNLETLASAGELSLNEAQCLRAYTKLSNLLKKNHRQMLLIFDEYEYFAKCGDRHNSFTPFRSQMDKYSREDGGIFCIISGAEKLSDFSARIGSPQFNLFTREEQVPPLEKEDFYKLWEDCRASCSDSARQLLDRCCPGSCCSNLDTLYNMCGGRPSYAKLLGDSWCQDGERDALDILSNSKWLDDIYRRQNEQRKKLLLEIALDKPTQENSDTKYLEEMYLITRNTDREIGGFSILGGLWKRYLLQRAELEYEVNFQNAWDLACMIVKRNKLHTLLEQRRSKGKMEDDWLEFKAALIPDAKQMEADKQEQKKQLTKDDYRWNVVRAILAMRNTRGGLILIGVKDNADVIGIETSDLSDSHYLSKGDFLRNNFFNQIQKNEFVLSETKINLDNCKWDFNCKADWLDYDILDVEGKKIIWICVKPLIPDEIKNYFIKECVRNHPMCTSKYILIRTDQQDTQRIYDIEEIKEHFEKMQNPSDDSLKKLRSIWFSLLGK